MEIIFIILGTFALFIAGISFIFGYVAGYNHNKNMGTVREVADMINKKG